MLKQRRTGGDRRGIVAADRELITPGADAH
jgi:hypothetical protein